MAGAVNTCTEKNMKHHVSNILYVFSFICSFLSKKYITRDIIKKFVQHIDNIKVEINSIIPIILVLRQMCLYLV